MRSRAPVVLIALGGVWGASFLFIKVAVDEIAPLEVAGGRLFFGALAVVLVMAVKRRPVPHSPSLIAKVALMGLLSNVVPFTLIAWAEVHIDSGIASVLNSTMPLFTALFAAAILAEERFTAGRLAGLIVGFLGVVALSGGDILRITDNDVLGQLAVVGASACYGAGAVYARTLLRSEDPLGLSALQLILATLLAVLLSLAVEGPPEYSMSVKGWLSLLTLGVVGSGFAYVAYLWLIDNLGSVRASLVTYIIPAVGLLLGWSVLDEEIGLSTILGAALIILGIATVMQGQAPASERAITLATE